MAIKYKKALIFSIISILMSFLFILVFSSFIHVPLDQKTQIGVVEIQRLESFLELFPEYFGTSIERASYEVLPYLVNESPLNTNFSTAFVNCMIYGKINDTSQEKCSLTGNNITLDVILDEISLLVSDIYRGKCTINVLSLNVTQTEPYKLKVFAKSNLFFEKPDKLTFSMDFDIIQNVNLIGVTNPLTKDIDKREITFGENEFFTKKEFYGNLSLIKDYVDNGYSFIDVLAPSFIDILEGKTEPGEFNDSKQLGLNSFINSMTSDGNLTYKENRSFLSWEYYRDLEINKSDLRLINYSDLARKNLTFYKFDLLDDFQIDEEHLFYATSAGECDCDNVGCYCYTT